MMFTNYLPDEPENPFRLTQGVPSVYFAQGIIADSIANVKYSSVQIVGEQLHKFSKILGVVSKF
jgi:hypothetical protein